MTQLNKLNLDNSWRKMLLQVMFGGILCLLIPFAFAGKADASKPIKIDADHATLDQKHMVSVFSGKVVITKGTLVVHADQGVASQDKGGNRVLDLLGRPVTFRQVADDGQIINGQCDKFHYNTQTSLAVLKGRARVKKGKSVVIGDTLTYNTKTQMYSAVSGLKSGVSKKSRGRITVILDQADTQNPESKQAESETKGKEIASGTQRTTNSQSDVTGLTPANANGAGGGFGR